MAELHRVLGAALSERAQFVDVTEHVGKRYESFDCLGIAAAVCALNLATAAVQVADNTAKVIFRCHHFNLHDRLKQLDAGLAGHFAHRAATADFESDRR